MDGAYTAQGEMINAYKFLAEKPQSKRPLVGPFLDGR
jgi:hypothetical protein